MVQPLYDVAGLGNAIVDIIARCDDAFITAQGLEKGIMRLIDAPEAARLYGEMGPAVEVSGGSVPNSCVGVASFGGKAASWAGSPRTSSARFSPMIFAPPAWLSIAKPVGRQRADRPLSDPGDARWRADHEHQSRRVGRAERARGGCGADRRGASRFIWRGIPSTGRQARPPSTRRHGSRGPPAPRSR